MLSIPLEERQERRWVLFLGFKNSVTEIAIESYTVRNTIVYVEYNDEPSLKMVKEIGLILWRIFLNHIGRKNFIKRRTFYLGTDKYGRDLLSRMLIGSRVSISIGVVAVLISLIVGIFLVR
jgi:peptide/nickel transport system permease protein